MEATIQQFFVFCLAAVAVLEIYLNLRNRNCVRQNRNQVPSKFEHQVSLKEHQKAAAYTLEKGRFARAIILYSAVLTYLWTVGGGLQWIAELVPKWSSNPIVQGLLFFGVFGFLSLLLGLPVKIYSTFVIEEKYGFNKTGPRLFVMDLLKSLLLGSVLGAPLLALILALMESFPTSWWILAFIVTTAFQFFLLWIYPNVIAPQFNKFSPLEEGETKQRIQQLAQRVHFSLQGIFVMDASRRSAHGNAYFTGLGKQKRIVFFDNLLQTLTPAEIESVMAHELGHFKKKHIQQSLIRSLLISLIGFYLLYLFSHSPLFFKAHGLKEVSTYGALMLFSQVIGVYTFPLAPLFKWISRKNEFEADAFAATHANAQDLITSLVKLHKDNASTLTPDPLYTQFYYSHPPVNERVDHLQQLSQSM